MSSMRLVRWPRTRRAAVGARGRGEPGLPGRQVPQGAGLRLSCERAAEPGRRAAPAGHRPGPGWPEAVGRARVWGPELCAVGRGSWRRAFGKEFCISCFI